MPALIPLDVPNALAHELARVLTADRKPPRRICAVCGIVKAPRGYGPGLCAPCSRLAAQGRLGEKSTEGP